MPKWIGNRFGNIVPIAPNQAAPSAIYNLFDQYYSRQDSGWITPEGMEASGGVISEYTDPGSGNVYRAHIFTASGEFQATSIGSYGANVEFLLVAGGGGGGNANSPGHGGNGGGGAGGFVEGNALPVAINTPFTVTVGATGMGGQV